jgi:stage II sporulation protein D
MDRRFDDNLKVTARNGELRMVNNIDLDNYVAGVVEAEVGRKPPKEYFKLQAIICRTYALSNTHKHLYEGFNLCDEVHCQAYHGKTFFTAIVDAAMQTRGAVIVDSDIQLITAAFHSNCGGQTVNSEDVWSKSLYYLRAVQDTFCLNKKNSVWEKELDKHQWADYLASRGQVASPKDQYCSYNAPMRKVHFLNTGYTFEELRNRFHLRSTFFNVNEKEGKVLLEGRGYGHGVGLCQEGAMEMAAQGYSYAEILHFYYSGVHIIDLAALDFFKED